MAGSLWTKLWKQWFAWWSGSSRQALGEVTPSEELTTWVRQHDVALPAGVVKYSRLMPREIEGRLEASVCRSSGLEEAGIWQICSEHFDPFNIGKPAIGRGVGPASVVYDQAFSLDPNGDPYPQHADIVGWSNDPNTAYEDKRQWWMIKAKLMAQHFRYVNRPAGL